LNYQKKTRFQLFLSLIILFFVTGCTSNPKANNSMIGVNIDSQPRKIPLIETEKRNQYGPSIQSSQRYYNKKKSKKEPVLALILGPGLNRVVSQITLISKLEENQIPIHIISGTGMGAIVAALYSSGMKPSKIEWFFYKLFKEIANHKPYTRNWLNQMRPIINSAFQSQLIQNSKKTLVIPLFDNSKKEVVYLSRGKMVETLMANLMLASDKGRGRYSTALQKEIFNSIKIRKIGADMVVGIDVLNKDITFNSTSDYLVGIFGRITGMISREQSTLDIYFSPPMKGLPLDSVEELANYVQIGMRSGEKLSTIVEEEINNWKSKHNIN
jgi:hypothetical protein